MYEQLCPVCKKGQILFHQTVDEVYDFQLINQEAISSDWPSKRTVTTSYFLCNNCKQIWSNLKELMEYFNE